MSPNPCDVEIIGSWNGTAWVPGYDANGNVTSFRTRRVEILTMSYDNLNRLTRKTVPDRAGLDATHERDVHFDYDLFGGLESACFGVVGNENTVSTDCVSNTFDALGQVTASTAAMDGVSRQLGYEYDEAGNLTRLTHPDSKYILYNRRSSGAFYYAYMSDGAAQLFYPVLDTAGRPYRLYRWDTTAATWTNQYEQRGYDAISRVSSLATVLPGTTYDTTTSFTWNPASQIASQARTNDVYAWTGAAADTDLYTPNGLSQYTAVDGAGYSYDANGNLTNDGTHTYTYDVENRLVRRASGSTSADLRYDPLGRLYEVVGSDTGTTRFLYDGSDLVVEYDGGNPGTRLRRYVHGLGAGDDPQVWFEGSGVADSARRYLYADERGSIVAVTNSTGTVLNLNTYEEHGIPGSTNEGRFQYTGQAWLPELGMYYYKARMYSPTLGRFMQTDPIGYGDGMNIYAYVGGDPVNAVDPTGTVETIVVTGIRARYCDSTCAAVNRWRYEPLRGDHRNDRRSLCYTRNFREYRTCMNDFNQADSGEDISDEVAGEQEEAEDENSLANDICVAAVSGATGLGAEEYDRRMQRYERAVRPVVGNELPSSVEGRSSLTKLGRIWRKIKNWRGAAVAAVSSFLGYKIEDKVIGACESLD